MNEKFRRHFWRKSEDALLDEFKRNCSLIKDIIYVYCIDTLWENHLKCIVGNGDSVPRKQQKPYLGEAMTEEIEYAQLNFHKSHGLENVHELHTVEVKEPLKPKELQCKEPFQDIPTSSFRWRICALVALILCLLLLVGLLVLGIKFIQVTMDLQVQHRDLQLAWEDLKMNSSRKILHIKANLCLEGEKVDTNSGKKTWQESKNFCSSWNSTLLIPQEKSRNWVQNTFQQTNFWIGIYKDRSGQWFETNEVPCSKKYLSMSWFYLRNVRNQEECAYLSSWYVYSETGCHSETIHHWICEKAAYELT
ncbi:natural killer cells antigen CD94-like isoform X2 [Hemicordylus capensis]|uniref:natural killer cells antigen CD94-like isoform X2 n=1 Tax=Hemicordylus capensis TaxID=884348 RepID=UPI002302B4D1|nr:natural killer cells antigen CD94-like isoform X2 [Hemicordylus capensis]